MSVNKTLMKKYAELTVRVGANVQKGQNVVVVSNVLTHEFCEMVVKECYKAKASIVNVEWNDDLISNYTYKNAKLDELTTVKNWVIEKYKDKLNTLPAMIYIDGDDPDALKGIDPKRIAKVRKETGKVIRPIRKEMENKYQWTIIGCPTLKWAKKVYPELSVNQAYNKLWEAVLRTARCDLNAVENWKNHNEYLLDKCNKLNNLNIKTLEYKASNGTNFTIDLIKGVIFTAGISNTLSGIKYNPNMPTEECFTTPNKYSCNGTVYANKPLSLNGNVLTDFGFRFENGKVVEVLSKDDNTKKLLEETINIDEGASRLGEVALVPYDSPVNKENILFYNTLFDENACCHLALGMGFEDCIQGFESMTREEIEKFDLNDSMIHVDFMIGTNDLSIVAILDSGEKVQIFKDGIWNI